MLGLFTRLAAATALLLVVSFTVANVHALLGDAYRSGADLCGCMGTVVPLDHKGALAMDAAMLVMAAPLAVFKTRLLSLGSRFSLGFRSLSQGRLAHSTPAHVIMVLFALLLALPLPMFVSNQTPVAAADGASVQSVIDNALKDGRPVFLFAYLETCSYCQKQNPIIERLELDYGERVAFVKADGAQEKEIVTTFGFDGFPGMALISGKDKAGGYVYRSFVGYTSEETLRAAIEALLNGGYSAVDMLIGQGLAQGRPAFLFIYAEWCTYCKKQKPVIDSLEEEYGERVAFIRADSAEYPEALQEFNVTGFPAMFIITERGDAGYAYRGFSGFTERETLARMLDYVLQNGLLPAGGLGYEHHSCSVATCYENCIADRFEYPSLMEVERFLTDTALDCLDAKAGEMFKDAYDGAKRGECASVCATADDPREYGDCAQCAIGETIGKIPAAGCVVTLWSALGDVLEPHADCLAECSAPSSTWEKNWGHECRDYQGEQTRCAGPNVLETLGCRDCGWVVTDVYVCDGGCEMTATGAVCKGKCKDEWCDDGDACTIDWCYMGECRHERKLGEECGCPPSCDDGDPCTTDYCDSSGACQHAVDTACRCQTMSCDDGDACTSDSCDPSTGACVHSRSPGCDQPDDNEDASSPDYGGSAQSDPNAEIAVLNNGYSLLLMNRLEGLGIATALIQSIDQAFAYPVLVIPTGGLTGLDTSEVFRAKLERYVSQGGTLISFTQQHGREFAALPGGQLGGYGWIEDQSCQYQSVGIGQYHPILSGYAPLSGYATTQLLSINVDGFFVSLPPEASVLLVRAKNGQPAMVLYEYGQGQVLASTIYSDMAPSLYQGLQEEGILLRDLFAWALSQDDVETLPLSDSVLSIPVRNPYVGEAELPAFEAGDEVTLNIDVTNDNLTTAADSIKFLVSAPDFHQSWVEVAESVGAGETRPVNLAFATDVSSENGVWTVLYFLYSGDNFIGAAIGARFTLSYDPRSYSLFKAVVTLRSPTGNVVLEEEQHISIPPGGIGALQVALPPTLQRGVWSVRYSVVMGDGRVLLSSLKRFARSDCTDVPGGWAYQASRIGFDVVSDHDEVVAGAEETFYIHVYNRNEAAVDVRYTIDWTHGPIVEEETVNVPAGSMVTRTYTMEVHNIGRLWVHFHLVGGGYLGDASKGIDTFLPYTAVSVSTDRSSYTVGDSVVATVGLTNMGRLPQDAHVAVLMQDGKLNTVLEQVFDVTLQSYWELGDRATETRVIELALPDGIATGAYNVCVVAYEGANRMGQDTARFDFFTPYAISIILDRPSLSYEAGGTIQINVAITNVSSSHRESDVEIDAPELGSAMMVHVDLEPGASQTFAYHVMDIPSDIASGSHLISVVVADGGYKKVASFTVPALRLALGLGSSSYTAGEMMTLLIENVGGVRAQWSCILEPSFARDPLLATGTLMPGQADNTAASVAIPVSTPPGKYYVNAQCEASDSTFYLAQYVDISGADILLTLADTQSDPGDEVSIAVSNTGAVDTTALCSVDLIDRYGYAVLHESGISKDLPRGGSSALTFTVPVWASGGQYRVEASCVDNFSLRVSSLRVHLDVSGVRGDLTAVTDKTVYGNSETIDVQTHIVNSTQPLSGMLHLWMWEAAGSRAGASQEWAKQYGAVPSTDPAAATAVDADGNIYVTVADYNGSNTDYLTMKYSAAGEPLWTAPARHAGWGNAYDFPRAIAVDASGSVYVTGSAWEQKPGSTSAKLTCTTIKYSSVGDQQWVAYYHGPAYDECAAIAADGGYVYVVGRSWNSATSWDYLTVKYDAATGSQEWASLRDGTGHYDDTATAVAVDGSGNVYITGYTYEGSTAGNRITTVKYNSGGEYQWDSQSEYGTSKPAYIALSPSGASVFVAGTAGGFALMKYDATDGRQEWARYHSGPMGADTLTGLAVDGSGNVLVAGSIVVAMTGPEMPDLDFGVVKYDAAGDLLWEASYGVPGSHQDRPYGMALDSEGNVYVTGGVWTSGWVWEWATLKYDGDNGNLDWSASYTGLDESDDKALAVAVSDEGGIYVAGTSSSGYAVVKYVETTSGDAVWETDIPLDLLAAEARDISTLVNIPTELAGITGKLYLGARLLNAGSQTVAESEPWAFYITAGGLSITLETSPEKDFYRPGDTIAITGVVTNNGTATEDCTLTVDKDGAVIHTEVFSLGAGESRVYSISTAAVSTFQVSAAVNSVTVTDTVTVKPYNLSAEIISPDVVGLAPFEAAVLLQNSSDMDYTLHVVLAAAAWDITLAAGGSALLQTNLTIAGDAVLTAVITGDVPLTVQKSVAMGERVTVEVSPEQTYEEGDVEVPFTVTNSGLLDANFSITFELEGQVITRQVSVPASSTFAGTVTVNLTEGSHALVYSSPYGSGSVEIHATGEPEFVVTEMPANTDLVAGDPTWVFKVKNIGGSEGAAFFTLTMPDYQETKLQWLKPGEEKEFSFTFIIRDDLEGKDYKASYTLNGVTTEFVFHLDGPKVTVAASLDQIFYESGDTAILTLQVTNTSEFNLALFARVQLGDYLETVDFQLDGLGASETLTFNVPVVFDSGKLFYGIYMSSGRGLHLNALYVREKQPLLLYMDKQVYDMGEEAIIAVEPDTAGTLTLTAPGGFSVNTPLSGAASFSFTIPALVKGTYYVEYAFSSGAGTVTGRYPFDVRGYSARILRLALDRDKYAPGDTMNIVLDAELNLAVEGGNVRYRIYDWKNNLLDDFTVAAALTAGDNRIVTSRVFSADVSGMVLMVATLTGDLPGQPGTMLASAIRYFDGGGTNQAPEAYGGPIYVATEGAVVIFDAGLSSDPEGDPLEFRWDFNNDGTWDTGWSSTPTASYSWNDDHRGFATVEVTDGNRSATATVEVWIRNVSPVVDAGPDDSLSQGETFSSSGSFTDPGSDTWTATVDYGDGSGVQPLVLVGKSFDLSHTYTASGVYTVTVTVSDADGPSGSDTAIVTVDIQTYTIKATAGAGGTITPSGDVVVAYGDNQAFAIIPDTGYHIADVLVDGASVGALASYEFPDVTASHTIEAVFAIDTFTVVVTADPTEGGSVSGGGTYGYGQTVELLATGNAGYHFVNWTEEGSEVSTSATYSFTATASRTLVAHFAVDAFTIVVAAEPTEGGSVSGGGTYGYGQTVELLATANAGYQFVNWTEDGEEVSTDAAYSFTATANRTLVAHFALDTFTITVTADPTGGGSVSGGGTYGYGQTVDLLATANAGYHFVNWTEDGSEVSTSAAYSFTATANRTLVAHFAIDTFTITATASAGGTITPLGAVPVTYGADQTFVITPDIGYYIADVLVDGASVGAVDTHTFYSVIADHTISAVFGAAEHTLVIIVDGNGSVTKDPELAAYAHGSQVTLTAVPDPGWVFVGWSGDLSGTTNPAVVTMNSDKRVTATFAEMGEVGTMTWLVSLANPSVYGQKVTFVALVLPREWGSGMPTGTVEFREGDAVLGAADLSRWGLAIFSTSSLSVGIHSVTAVYKGDDTFGGSVSPVLVQKVNKARTAVRLTSSVNPSWPGQTVTLTVTISAREPGSGTPTGSVTFKDGWRTLGTAAVDGSGKAAWPATLLAPGLHYITAVYEGDERFEGSRSAVLIQVVRCG
ncbi:MAG: Ig-like domain repeat protein [Dehalococcoidia bacterium]|nr:Ig-like domain repeat protein [Dehalococcoidia bacterium]